MGTRALRNEMWGFESSCFVCEPRNEAGLRIPFEHDEDAELVRGAFTLDERFSGAPTYLHGGVTLAVLDEAMAWATIAIGGRFAVTVETTTRFGRPVRVGRPYTVEARVTEAGEERMRTTGVVFDEQGRACAEASAEFHVLSVAQAVDAIGTDLTGDDASYLRP